jgi:hypothetical protein
MYKTMTYCEAIAVSVPAYGPAEMNQLLSATKFVSFTRGGRHSSFLRLPNDSHSSHRIGGSRCSGTRGPRDAGGTFCRFGITSPEWAETVASGALAAKRLQSRQGPRIRSIVDGNGNRMVVERENRHVNGIRCTRTSLVARVMLGSQCTHLCVELPLLLLPFAF